MEIAQGGRSEGVSRARSQYRLTVSGIPRSGSWQASSSLSDFSFTLGLFFLCHVLIPAFLQRHARVHDLKDMMREAGNVLYTDVRSDGSGVVEFSQEKDMLWALKNLNGSKMRAHTVSFYMFLSFFLSFFPFFFFLFAPFTCMCSIVFVYFLLFDQTKG